MEHLKQAFLNTHLFAGLTNLNDGFDSESIRYFSESDFRILLKRVEQLKLGIYGIEPWKNGAFFDAVGYEEFAETPTDPSWYNAAFEQFVATGETLQYAASYFIPQIE